jgi:hypothetical protein
MFKKMNELSVKQNIKFKLDPLHIVIYTYFLKN